MIKLKGSSVVSAFITPLKRYQLVSYYHVKTFFYESIP